MSFMFRLKILLTILREESKNKRPKVSGEILGSERDSNIGPAIGYADAGFCGFLQFRHGMQLKISHDRFLSYPFQFMVYNNQCS
jgi:hypothetical protein